MLRFLPLLLLVACTVPADKSPRRTSETPPGTEVAVVHRFPEDWAGVWSGQLRILSTQGVQQTVPMTLEILPQDTSDRWTYHLVYGEDRAAGLRAYELVPVDPARGLWAIDERNSIRMEAYLFENQLVQRFEVMGNLLETILERHGPNELRWEILSGALEPASTTGGQTVDGEEIPPVNAYPIRVRQTATLRRE